MYEEVIILEQEVEDARPASSNLVLFHDLPS